MKSDTPNRSSSVGVDALVNPKRLLIKKTDYVATLTTNGFERREGIKIKQQDSYVLFLSSFRSILLSLTFEVVENQSWESDA